MRQKTIAGEVVIEGRGVHRGEKVKVILKPLHEDSGIIFKIMGNPPVSVKADLSSVVATERATALGIKNHFVCTTEHLLSALYGLGIDNVLVEVYGSELPIMDGSSLGFANGILSVGIKDLNKEKKAYYIKDAFEFRMGRKRIIFSPSDTLEIIYNISYDHPLVGDQSYHFVFSFEDYYYNISPSRTFGFLKDYKKLKEKGLATGANPYNTVVLSDDTCINPTPLRFRDEFVRHKILDLIGDLALLGGFLVGRIEVFYGGHHLHYTGLRKLRGINTLYLGLLNGLVTPKYPRVLINLL